MIPFIILIYLIPRFFNLELTQTALALIALLAFVVYLMIIGYMKIGHQGQLPMWFGLFFIVASGIALIGSIGVSGSEKLIELDARSQGFAFIGLGIGILLLVIGIKSASGWIYRLGHLK